MIISPVPVPLFDLAFLPMKVLFSFLRRTEAFPFWPSFFFSFTMSVNSFLGIGYSELSGASICLPVSAYSKCGTFTQWNTTQLLETMTSWNR